MINKKIWSNDKKRLLTYREMLDFDRPNPAYHTAVSELCKKNEIQLIENTPEEICALAIEMEKRIRGVWKETEEDIKLQEQFQDLYIQKYGYTDNNVRFSRVKISSDFIRQNRELLN
jgi:putative glycosyltransferase (TIGR04372 family)